MKDSSRMLAKFLGTLLASKGTLTLPEQKILLAALAHAGLFEEPVRTLLQVAAVVAGDEDEVLTEKLRKHLRRREAACREAEGR
jgi:hypothetical protein